MYFDTSLHAGLRGTAPVADGWENRPYSRLVRLKKLLIAGQMTEVAIRLVETSEALSAACDLVNTRYEKKGYGNGHRIPATSRHMTFTAEIGEDVVGTITLAADLGQGLAADKTFKEEVDQIRARPNTTICELTKFAFDAKVHSAELMAALFHVAYIYGHHCYAGTDLVIEVHARHVRFYQAMLGFKLAGEPKVNVSVDATLQLMALEVAEIRNSILLMSGRAGRCGSRSLYPHFLPLAEEELIYRELCRPTFEASSDVTRVFSDDSVVAHLDRLRASAVLQ